MADGRCYFGLRFVSAPIRQGGRSGAALFFILLGMFFGTDGVVKIPFDNFKLAQNVCSVALLFIMFYGGFGTNVRRGAQILIPNGDTALRLGDRLVINDPQSKS